MNRRSFLAWVGVGWVASSLPVAIVACSSADSGKSVESSRTDGFQVVGTIADLDKSGQILNEQFSAGPLLVIRNPTNLETVQAVNPTCTHQGCLVSWKSERKAFACPCHNAQYSANGEVLEGPADKPLLSYDAKIEGNSVLVKKK